MIIQTRSLNELKVSVEHDTAFFLSIHNGQSKQYVKKKKIPNSRKNDRTTYLPLLFSNDLCLQPETSLNKMSVHRV